MADDTKPDLPTEPKPDPVTPPAAPAAEPAAPPVTSTVLDGKTERELALERELEASRKTLKDRETEAATVRDEFHRYKEQVETVTRPEPKPKRRRLFGVRREE